MSPLTTRADLAAFADDLLLATRPFASPSHSLITLPGTPGGYGTAVDGLEGFARTLLAAGFLVAGQHGADPHGHLERYAAGFAAGTDPHHRQRWVRPTEHGQAKVEAASLAIVLDLTRPWLWDRLDPLVQEQTVDYLAEIVGDTTYPRSNWLWFRITVETFLRSVGGPHSLTDIAEDLALFDSFYESGGWYRDGEDRNYDHYIGWAMHTYPTLWARMSGAADLAAPRAATDRERLERFLPDALALVGGNGSPLIQGRSLTYRFAAAAPLWVGAIAQVASVPLGQLRTAALGMIDHFRSHGVPNARGLLDIGWWGPWRPLAQRYSGTGSPYWATKGLLGLALPADHPAWTAPAPATPVVTEDRSFTIAAPSWAVSTTASDGVVRIANHGTDHGEVGQERGDSPLYARIGYSTHTAPLHRGADWTDPVDQSVVLVDAAGRRSHRGGMTPLHITATDTPGTTGGGPAAVAASRASAGWIQAAAEQIHHGSGIEGAYQRAGTITVISVLRGAWEVRLIHLSDPAPEAIALECGGWAPAFDAGVIVTQQPGRIDLHTPTASAATLALAGWTGQYPHHRNGASILGDHAVVGVLTAPATTGWRAAAIGLAATELGEAPRLTLTDSHAHIAWADQATTEVALNPEGAAASPGSMTPDPGHDPLEGGPTP